MGYPNAVVRDLRSLDKIVEKIVHRKPWLDITGKTADSKQRFLTYVDEDGENKFLQTSSKQQKQDSIATDHDGAHRIINALLTTYATTAHDFCIQNQVAVPLAFENRDKSFFHRPRRYASSPLRNWLSFVQQLQVRAALGLDTSLSRDQCALAVTHYYTKQKQVQRLLQESRPKSYLAANSNPFYGKNKSKVAASMLDLQLL